MTASSLDAAIDGLYQAPLGEFVAARGALARTLMGADAARVKKLVKPTVVPWSVNQVYWRARPVYDRLIRSGAALRTAQVAALGGGKADLRAASDAHRQAIADAVGQAERLAASAGLRPPPDALMRTFEAVSVAPDPAEPHGRLTRALQPAGFEALTGVKVVPAPRTHRAAAPPASAAPSRAEVRKAEAARKKREQEIRKAEAALARAKRKMAEAEAALRRTKE